MRYQAVNVNTNTVALACSTTSAGAALPATTLTPWYSVILYNSGTVPVFVVAGTGSAPTAVFPTTTPLAGKVIPPGAVVTYSLNKEFTHLAGITASGTATIYITTGVGE